MGDCTGIYIDDVNAAWRVSALSALGLAFVCLIPLVVVAITVWRSIHLRLQDILARVKDVAEGDLTKRTAVTSNDELGEVARWFNSAIDRLDEMIRAISQNAVQVAGASEELDVASNQITARSEETSAQAVMVSQAAQQVNQNLQTVATGAEEMSASIREIAKSASEASRIATSAVKPPKLRPPPSLSSATLPLRSGRSSRSLPPSPNRPTCSR